MLDERWCTRNLDLLPADEREVFTNEATQACALKKDMVTHNISRVQALGQPIAPFDAMNGGKDSKGPKGDRDSGLPEKLILCRPAESHVLSGLCQQQLSPSVNFYPSAYE